jgi:type I restriction enzyme S subunit
MIELGSVLSRVRRPISLAPDEDYKLVTIRLKQKGVCLRTTKVGSEIKSPMSVVSTGDFILSGIDARNGAFGIVPEELHGAVVTNDFWILEVDEGVVLSQYFLELTRADWFEAICQNCSSGTTQRIRLNKDLFFSHQVHFPPLDVQRERLGKIEELDELFRLNNEQLELIKDLRIRYLTE